MSLNRNGNTKTSSKSVVASKDITSLIESKGYETVPGFAPKAGFIYTETRAISARINQNYDGFTSAELKKSYKSFLGKPIYVNHANEDPDRTRGRVVATRYAEDGDDKYIAVIQEVDAVKYPKLAQELIEGGLDSVSMGCSAERTVCSYCGNEARGMFDMCAHVLNSKGQVLRRMGAGGMEDVLVYENCLDLGFFELSYVFDPADETAVVGNVVHARKASVQDGKRIYCDLPGCRRWTVPHGDNSEWVNGSGEFRTYDYCCAGHKSQFEADHPDWAFTAHLFNPVKAEAVRVQAFGEVEAPAPVDTLRDEGEEETEDFHRYVESPKELSDPDLSKAKELDRRDDGLEDQLDDSLDHGLEDQFGNPLDDELGGPDDGLAEGLPGEPGAQLPGEPGEQLPGGPEDGIDDVLAPGPEEENDLAYGLDLDNPPDMGLDGPENDELNPEGPEGDQGVFDKGLDPDPTNPDEGVGGVMETTDPNGLPAKEEVGDDPDAPNLGDEIAPEPEVEQNPDLDDALRPGPEEEMVDQDGNPAVNEQPAPEQQIDEPARALLDFFRPELAGDVVPAADSEADLDEALAPGPEEDEPPFPTTEQETAPRDEDREGDDVDPKTKMKSKRPNVARIANASNRASAQGKKQEHLAGKGTDMSRTRQADQSRNDQGEKEDTFITQTPPAEPVETGEGEKITNTEDNLVARIRRDREALLKLRARKERAAKIKSAGTKTSALSWEVYDDVGSVGGELPDGTLYGTTLGGEWELLDSDGEELDGGWAADLESAKAEIENAMAQHGIVAKTKEAEAQGEDLSGEDTDREDLFEDFVETQPKDASKKTSAAQRRLAHFAAWVKAAKKKGLKEASSAGELRGWAREYSKTANVAVGDVYPLLARELAAFRKKAEDEGESGAAKSEGNPFADGGKFDTDDDAGQDDSKEARRAAFKAARAAAKERAAKATKTADEKLDVAAPDGRVDVEAPTSDTTDDKAQETQFDKHDFGDNAGDDIADPDLSTDQNWLPGEGKKSSRKAEGIAAVRLAEAYVAAGLNEEGKSKWALASEFQQMTASVVADRTALCERFASVLATRESKTAGNRGSAPKNPIPQNLMGGGSPAARTAAARREASIGNSDSDLFMS